MRIIALAGLVFFVCLSTIFGPYIIDIVVLSSIPPSLVAPLIALDTLRMLFAVVLVYGWLRTWKILADLYFWRAIGKFRDPENS